jgi:hypothetical protein
LQALAFKLTGNITMKKAFSAPDTGLSQIESRSRQIIRPAKPTTAKSRTTKTEKESKR